MQNALMAEDDETVSRPPFHLRNGDLVVWTDITWRPTEAHIAKKRELEAEEAAKRKGVKKASPGKGGAKQSAKDKLLSKWQRKEGGGLKIRTYVEYMEDEQRKKEEKERKEQERGKDADADDGDSKVKVKMDAQLS